MEFPFEHLLVLRASLVRAPHERRQRKTKELIRQSALSFLSLPRYMLASTFYSSSTAL